MPTKLKRCQVSIPDEILPFLNGDCERGKMNLSTKISQIVAEYYQFTIPQPMIFGRARPLSVQSRRASRPLVFGEQRPPALEHLSDPHEIEASGKS